MARNKIRNSDIGAIINVSPKTVTNKITGVTAFTIDEAIKIRNTFFKGMDYDYLFATEKETA